MRLRRDWRRIRAGMVWIVLGAMMFFVLLVPQHAYGATQCPATREECQSFIDILVDSYVEEVGADNEAVYVVGPERFSILHQAIPCFQVLNVGRCTVAMNWLHSYFLSRQTKG